MDTKALEFYRNESKCTENSTLAGKETILYVDTQRIRGARNRYAPSKYISVLSPPDKGKYMFISYTSNPSLTTGRVFPGIQNNSNGRTEGSPFHVTPLYFVGRASLVLDKAIKSSNYKSWI